MNTDSALSMLSRYEALFELAGNINAATEISEAAHILARRLKYVADVFSWRYCRVEPATPGSEELTALVVDGYRGEATISHLPAAGLSEIERDLWETRRTRTLTGADLERVRSALPEHFQKPDLSQIYVCPRFIAGAPHGMHMFSKRREPFNDLDIKFLTLAAHTFHDKVHILREQQKRRELETAYLEQEIMLRQSEKLATLGRMSAGIAHEVNNPAAAALRSAQHLADGLGRLEHAAAAVGRLGLDETQTAALEKYRMHALEAVAEPPALDPVSAAEQEEEVEAWLEERSVGDPSMLAPALVAIGWGREQLDQVATSFTDAQVPAILTLLAQLHEANVLLGGIRSATGRVSRIVNALKSYSYLDQAPMQSVDVREGLNDTLMVFHNKLVDGVTVRTEFDSDLPRIEANGRELNQVWTNLIENAVRAMDGTGELTLRAYEEESWVVVEVADTGAGIAPDIQDCIFDPFFTTRPPGEGMGMGLNVSHNVVVHNHGGRIAVRSEPGDTCFRVCLPITPVTPAGQGDPQHRTDTGD